MGVLSKEEKMKKENKKFSELSDSEKINVIIYGLIWTIFILIGMGIIPY